MALMYDMETVNRAMTEAAKLYDPKKKSIRVKRVLDIFAGMKPVEVAPDKEYRHPFENDPFGVIWTAFRNLWPDADCTVGWNGDIRDERGEPVAGATVFEDGAVPHVAVNPSLEVWDATEVLAHELAHVAVGIDEQHGEKWKAAFDAIHVEYDRLVQEDHSDGEMQTKETHGVKLNGGAKA